MQVLTGVIIGYAVFSALTATAQNVEQLYLWRILEGLAFGAEWPVGAALMAEFATAERRGRTLAWVQSAWAVGWALANLSFVGAFHIFEPDIAWRAMFCVGVLPALAALAIRVGLKKHIDADRARTRTSGPRPKVFRELLSGGMRRTTVLSMLFGAAGLGSTYGIQTWLPSYLSEVRGLSVTGTATYIWMMIIGNWLGYVLGGKVHDRIGRRPAFTIFYLGTAATLFVFMAVPVGKTFAGMGMALVIGFFIAAQATGKGAFLTELFPARVRGTGSGIAYNVGRGIAAFSPAYIGAAAGALGLGNAIVISVVACTALTLVFLWCLPETKGIELT